MDYYNDADDIYKQFSFEDIEDLTYTTKYFSKKVRLESNITHPSKEVILSNSRLGLFLIDVAERAIGEEKIDRASKKLIKYIKKTICKEVNILAQDAWYNSLLKAFSLNCEEPHNWRRHLRFQQINITYDFMRQDGYFIKEHGDGSEEIAYSKDLHEYEDNKRMAQKYIKGVISRMYINYNRISDEAYSFEEIDEI